MVVLGMVAFTYVFVNQLPGAGSGSGTSSVPGSGTGTGAAPTATTRPDPSTPGSGPATTLDGEAQAYLDAVNPLAMELAGHQAEMTAVNDAWDADPQTIEFTEAEDRMAALSKAVADWTGRVKAVTAPAAFTETQNTLVAGADAAASAAAAALAGLRSSDPGEARRSAVGAFNTAVAAFNDAVVAAGGTLPTGA